MHAAYQSDVLTMVVRTRHRSSGANTPLHRQYRQQHVLLTILLLTGFTSAESRHSATDSFPSNFEEYDYSVLDPLTVFGSPYGGFSRATRSRLAALPLYLPDISDEEPTDEPEYMQVRDSDGRLFACRVYHEDELDPTTLNDSMFDSPVLREKDYAPAKQDKTLADTQKEARALKSLTTGSGVQDAEIKPAGMYGVTRALNVAEVELRMKEIANLCGQIHKGWWSYEWCNQQHVSQFHIEMQDDSSMVNILDVSSLGKYNSRAIYVDMRKQTPNKYAEDIVELARVTDTFKNGDKCDETNRPRTTYVHYMCCSDRIMERRKGLLKKDGKQFKSNAIAMMDLVEDLDKVCHYNVTMCTPLLCDTEEKFLLTGERTTQPPFTPEPKEDESVREILDRTLGTTCLQSSTGGWWTYELCHGHDIIQFHETTATTKTTAGAVITSKHMESEHNLGGCVVDVFNTVPADEEWRLVANVTVNTKGGGNGAYLEAEYTDGDVCDHADVTDSAIVAGAASDGGVSRSSTIRYFCGERYELTVNEDSTCHYIVQIKVPGLCKHPLFKAPVEKKQVVKCLPARDN